MQTMPNFARLSSGKLYVREYGAAAAFQPVGNCSAITLSPQSEDTTLTDHTQPGGGTYAKVTRVSDIQLAYTFHDFHPENLARGLRGATSYDTAGDVNEEPIAAHPNGYVLLARHATAITRVTSDDGETEYESGGDYVLDNGMLYIPATSSIPSPAAGKTNVRVTYKAAASGTVEGFSLGQKTFEFVFIGQNEANSEQVLRLACHKVSGGVLEEMSLLGDDFGEGSITSSLVADNSKYQAGTGNSQYFWLQVVGASDPTIGSGS